MESDAISSDSYDSSRPPLVSVVISTFGRGLFLEALFGALEAQTLTSSSFEVVIVDDASQDDTWALLGKVAARTPLRLLCLRLGENVGAGAARTTGTQHCRAPVVAFTDDDCLPTTGWLGHLVARLSPGPTGDPAAVIVQGRTVPWPTDADSAGPWARTVWVLRPTWLFETCNIAYRRKDLVAVGGFPGRAEAPATITGRPTGEDALLGWKVVDLGSRLVFEPEALVHHRNFTESYLDWLLEHRGKAVFPALVARNPLARRTLWARWFLAPRTAAFDLAVVGGLLWMATKRPHWAVSMAPWVWLALPEASQRGGAHPAVRLAQLALGDLVGFTSLVKGSLRSRSIVL